ncbi:unnamed protein product [Bubo scandiacus]
MAAGGSLAPAGLLWLCLAPAALLRLRQPQPVLVVKPGEPVEISCEVSEDVESKYSLAWYQRGEDGPELLLECGKETKRGFSCSYRRPTVTLSIASAQPQHSGLYLCAHCTARVSDFGSGTARCWWECRELRGFIQPLAELLEGLKRGRYDRGLSSFQQSVAMDRIQRIIGVLQKPEMGARYLGTLLQVEGMLRVWFPHVAPKPPPQDPAPASALLRRRPPAGPPGAPRCRRLPTDAPSSIPVGTSHRGGHPRCHHPAQTGTPTSPPAPDA